MYRKAGIICAAITAALILSTNAAPRAFHFVILGDRTGEAQAGVYEQAWREAAAQKPAFILTVGDMIEGLRDAAAEKQWEDVQAIVKPYRKIPLYLTPGNHDIWSPASETLYRKYSGHAPNYSFDYEQAHFTILDNSRSPELGQEDTKFLAEDLQAHASAPVKFIVSHQPLWLTAIALRGTTLPLHRLAKQYGVKYIIAGHVHQLIHLELEGITYISVPSSGGHLRGSKAYADGWFFGYETVNIEGDTIDLKFHELKPPKGEGHVTKPADWGMLGLVNRPAQ